MRIRKSLPPNIVAIKAKFGHVITEHTIYTYAPFVYVPSGEPMSGSLMAHEKVHLAQQGDDPVEWWENYLADYVFRFEQELEAHRAEWRAARQVTHRRRRTQALTAIARRLASPLYGSLVTFPEAKRMIMIP